MNIYLKRIYDLDFDYDKPHVAEKFLKALAENSSIYKYALKFCEIMESEDVDQRVRELAETVPGMKLPPENQVDYFIDSLRYYEHADQCKFNSDQYLVAENRYAYLLKTSDHELEKIFFPNIYKTRKDYLISIVNNSLKFTVDSSNSSMLGNKAVFSIDEGPKKYYHDLPDRYKVLADLYIKNCLQKFRNA